MSGNMPYIIGEHWNLRVRETLITLTERLDKMEHRLEAIEESVFASREQNSIHQKENANAKETNN